MRMAYARFVVLIVLCLFGGSELRAQFWQKCTLPNPYSSGFYLDVFFLPSNPQYGWVCGHQGYVLRTTDGGGSWQGTVVPYQGRSGGHLESVHFVTQQIGYCSGPCGVFASTDGGASWSDISPTMPGSQSPWGLYFLNASWGVVVGGGCGGTQGFALTTNGGSTWSYSTGNLPASGMTDALLYSNGRGFAVGSGQLWRTLDSGRTWSPFQSGFASIWNEEISQSGASFLLPWAGSQCAGGGGGGGGRFTTDSGATWTTYQTAQPMYGSFLLNSTTGWICGNARSMYKTTDAGATWELKNCGIDGDLDDCWFINDTTGFVVGNAVYRYSAAERSISKTISTLGPICYPGVIYDTIWVRNRSFSGTGATWNLAGTDIQHFNVLQPVSTSFGIPSCDSAMIVVRFQPRSPGTKTITLSVTVNNQVTLSTIITGTTRVVNAFPTDTLFTVRPAPCGVPVRLVTTWNNSSQQSDQVIQVTRLSGDVFSADPALPVIIPPGGGSVQSFITLADTGWKVGRYLFRVGPCLKDTVITLRAYGVSPIVNTPGARSYKTTCLQAAYDSIPVLNTGNSDLIISAADIIGGSAEFSIEGWNTGEFVPLTIAPKATKYLYIRYAPKNGGAASATLRLATNDATTVRGNKTRVDIALSGQSGGVKYELSATTLNFGRVCVPAQEERVWRVVNTGTGSITLASNHVVPTPFTVMASRNLPSVIAPGDSLLVRVLFQTSVPGKFRDSLVLGISPCDSIPIVIPITAEAISSSLAIAPTAVLRQLRRGSTDTVCVDVQSLGYAEAILDSLVLDPPLGGARTGARIISGAAVPVRLDSGSSLRVCIEILADSVGTWSGTLRAFGKNPCVSFASLPVTVVVSDSRLSIGPGRVTTPVQRCSTTARLDTIVIVNDGSVPDSLVDARVQSAGSTAFTLVYPTTFPVAIPPGARLPVVIKSMQLAQGIDSAECVLSFATAFSGVPYRVPLRAAYLATSTTLRDTLVDAGVHQPCDAPLRSTLHFVNTGLLSDTLQLDAAGLHPALVLASRIVVPAGDSAVADLLFTPWGLSPQDIQQQLRWTSTVCGTVLTARFVATIVDPHLRVTPTAINAGTLWKGTQSRFTVGVVNPSSVPRQILRWYLRGPGASEFSVSAPPSATLQPADSLTMYVDALSVSEGDHTAELVIVETSSCTDSTIVTLQSQTPREVYRAHLSVQDGVIVDVNDSTDVHLVLRTDDTSKTALFNAGVRSLGVSLQFNKALMNVLDVNYSAGGKTLALPWTRTPDGIAISFAASDIPMLGHSDTLARIRAQGMQNIPNYTDVTVTSFSADAPPDKNLELSWDNGDFAVQACVKWARITVVEPMALVVRSIPATSTAEIEVLNSATPEVRARIYAVNGNIVGDHAVTLSASSALLRLPVSDLYSGVYVIVVEDGIGQRRVCRMIVEH